MTTALQRFQAAPLHWVNLSGTMVAYRKFGTGPAVVMVHGWPLSGITYRGLVEELQDDFTCYVLDLPGAGDSPWSPSIKRLTQDFGALVHRFVDALKIDRFALIGQDSGGAVARMAAAQAGDRVTALALTNTEIPGHHSILFRLFPMFGRMPGSAWILKMLLRSRTYLRSVLGFGAFFEDLSLIDGEFFEASIKPLLRDPTSRLQAIGTLEPDFLDHLQRAHDRLRAPMLCIWGDNEPFFPVAQARVMVDRYPGPARLEVIKGKKVLVHEESTAEVAALMRPFLVEHNQVRHIQAISA